MSPAVPDTYTNTPPRAGAGSDVQPGPPPNLPEFTTVRNGFHPAQVEQWAAQLLHRVTEAERGVAELAGKLAEAAGKEAESPQGQKMLADLVKLAADELTGQQSAASAAAKKLLDDAAGQRLKILADAELEAENLVAGAHQQADSLLEDSRLEAKQKLDAASVRSAAVAAGADRRLRALTAQHEETLLRIGQVNKVTGDLLAREKDRGSLTDEVNRVLPAEVAASAPAQLPADGGG